MPEETFKNHSWNAADVNKSLVEERIAQLEAISARRNELLRQMYYMIRRRHDVGTVLTVQEEGEEKGDEDLHVFLQRFDLNKNPETGMIENYSDNEVTNTLFSGQESLPPSPSCSEDYNVPVDHIVNVKPVLSKSNTSGNMKPKVELVDDDHDELDLIGTTAPSEISPPRRLSPSSSSAVVPTKDAEMHTHSTHTRHSSESIVEFGQNTKGTVASPAGETDGEQEVEEQEGGENQREEEEEIEKAESDSHVPDDGKLEIEDVASEGMDVDEGDAARLDINTDILDVTYKGQVDTDASALEKTDFAELGPQEDTIVQATEIVEAERQTAVQENSEMNVEVVSGLPVYGSHESEATGHVVRPIVIFEPMQPVPEEVHFEFTPQMVPEPPKSAPVHHRYEYKAIYPLPPLKSLPAEFNRKIKTTKQRKREKDREKTDGKKELKDEWFPMGINKWAATLNANPVWKKVSRASKCLSTREWGVAMSELKIIRALDRIERLKDSGKWSYRQPKKQKGVGSMPKTHWDYLMDEMKWMRIDFREERKWKMALAYNLSTAVLEWHSLRSWDERITKGICVKWKKLLNGREDYMAKMKSPSEPMEIDEVARPDVPMSPKTMLLQVDYGSEDEEEDDQDKEQQSVADALEPRSILEEAFDAADLRDNGNIEANLEPKIEDVDYSSILKAHDQGPSFEGQDQDMEEPDDEKVNVSASSGLKSTSSDPILGTKSAESSSIGEGEQIVSAKLSAKVNSYLPLREKIAYSSLEQLFLDFDNLDMSKISDNGIDLLPPADLSSIFPDLQPLGFVDGPPAIPNNVVFENKKKPEKKVDDPHRRVEETLYTKLFPTSHFMHAKPTLIGALHPSKRWKDNKWKPMEETPVFPDSESPIKSQDEISNELFDSRSSNSPASVLAMQMQAAFLKEKDPRKRGADHLWSTADDILLKSLIDKYPNNWALISECFNGSRLTTWTDKRTPRDCLERWKEKWGPEIRHRPADPAPAATDENAATATPTQMTTRGVKRLASTSVSSPITPSTASGSEPKKRRRHFLVQECIRKTAKKRAEHAQKLAANQRKTPAIHETHGQYNKLPKLTPAELSRMKAEKDAREAQEAVNARRRQEELARQNHLRETQRPGGNNVPTPQGQIAQQTQPQAPARPPTTNLAVPQIRNQANIPRISTPSMAGGPRLSPQQKMIQMQQARAAVAAQQSQQAQVQLHAHTQALQGATQNTTNIPSANINGTNLNGSHMVPPFVDRGTTPSPAHISPPRASATPSNAMHSPRPEQVQSMIQASQVAGNGIPRPTNMGGHYYLPNPTFTQEQVHAALRLQMLTVQQQQQVQQAAAAQQQQGNQVTGTFPPQP